MYVSYVCISHSFHKYLSLLLTIIIKGYIFLQIPCFWGKGNNSAKIEIGEEIKDGTMKKCVHKMGKKLQCGKIGKLTLSEKHIPLS